MSIPLKTYLKLSGCLIAVSIATSCSYTQTRPLVFVLCTPIVLFCIYEVFATPKNQDDES